jgi:hypothetical protein
MVLYCAKLKKNDPSSLLQFVVQSFAHVIMLLGTLHHVIFPRIIIVTHILILSYFNLYD